MQTHRTHRLMATAFALALTAGAASAQVVHLDVAKAIAGGVTPGDSPGWPIRITTPGHYVLAQNLGLQLGVNAIVIDADDVTLDLGGFAILSNGDCSMPDSSTAVVICNMPGTASLAGRAAASAVRVNGRNVVLRNGSIKGFMGHGVYATGGGLWIDGLRVHDNMYDGLSLYNGGGATNSGYRVTNTDLFMNRGNGIAGVSVMIDRVVARANGENGIEVSHGLISHTMATMNRLAGLVGAGGPNPTSVRHSQFQFNRGPQEVQGDLVSGGGNVANATVF